MAADHLQCGLVHRVLRLQPHARQWLLRRGRLRGSDLSDRLLLFGLNAPNTADRWDKLCSNLVAWLLTLPPSRRSDDLQRRGPTDLGLPGGRAGVRKMWPSLAWTTKSHLSIHGSSLTSINQGAERTGYEAALLLDEWMSGKKVVPGNGGDARRHRRSAFHADSRHSNSDIAAALRFIHAGERADRRG